MKKIKFNTCMGIFKEFKKIILKIKINSNEERVHESMKQNEKPTALIMIFGATGDLANRKLFPSLYQLFVKGNFPNILPSLGWPEDPFK